MKTKINDCTNSKNIIINTDINNPNVQPIKKIKKKIKFILYTKEEIENDRSNAYKYLF